jgi:hypothetical protein
MKKEYIVGGLAIVGAIALFAYLKPKKKLNSDGFYGANGKTTYLGKAQAPKGRCAWCRDSEGEVYHTGGNRSCDSGDRCITQYSY